MKAIIVKYLSPTHTKGARLKAYDMDGNSLIVPYDHAAERGVSERRVAEELCDEMGWHGKETLVEGAIAEGAVFVFPPRH